MITDARIFFHPSTFSSWYSSWPVEPFWRREIFARIEAPPATGE
jgi:hypothetical protein